MKENFIPMKTKWFVHILIFFLVAVFSVDPWPNLMLTVAQLVFVPIMLQVVLTKENRLYYYFAIPVFVSVALLQMTSETNYDWLLAGIYLLFTFIIAIYGFNRFLHRGFTHFEEFLIDAGMMYLFVGGLWFFASITDIETGFPSILTWLTAIHFHYSSFLLLVFTGLLGRRYKPNSFKLFGTIILLSPMVVAVGITFSPWLELVSVLLYIVGIYGIIGIVVKTTFPSTIQKMLVLLSIGSLGFTIHFSLVYATGNALGLFGLTVGFMLKFHGFFNCVIFGLIGVVTWTFWTPESKHVGVGFEISNIKGNFTVGEQVLKEKQGRELYTGLIDDLSWYVEEHRIPPSIRDFYENTDQYRLYSQVHWKRWFKPFASIYRLFSRKVQQLNLPFSNEQMEMTGDIVAMEDGRNRTRAWIRKINKEIIFVALYAEYKTNQKSYMNISLPLPFSTMVGILELSFEKEKLLISSKANRNNEAGIYLAFKSYVFKLPLQEQFIIEELEVGKLIATHKMTIFSLPFLTIEYVMEKRGS